jgi:hypothetical protein
MSALAAAGLALCLSAANGTSTAIAGDRFVLSWMHSIEKTQWVEEWSLAPTGLRLLRAQVKGSGAGMEPPEGATLIDGWWSYAPALPPQPELTLAASVFSADHTLCIGGLCQPLAQWVGGVAGRFSQESLGPIRLLACPAAP